MSKKAMNDCCAFWALYICLNETAQENQEAEAQSWLDWMEELAEKEEALAKQEQQVVSLQCAHCQDTIETLNDKVMSLLAKQEQRSVSEQLGEQETNRLIQQRDHAHEIIDKLCDAVLGFDRHEWSSAYFFEDAVNEVEEKMWQLSKQEQGEPVATPQAIYNKVCLGLAEAGCKLSEQQKMALASLVQDTTPQQRKPLTDEERELIVKNNTCEGYNGDYYLVFDIIDDVEAAHGITASAAEDSARSKT